MLALRIRTGCVANHQPVALGGSDDRGAADFCLAGVILFLVGLPVMNVGLALWLHNRDRVQVQSSAWMPQIGLGRRGPALRWDF